MLPHAVRQGFTRQPGNTRLSSLRQAVHTWEGLAGAYRSAGKVGGNLRPFADLASPSAGGSGKGGAAAGSAWQLGRGSGSATASARQVLATAGICEHGFCRFRHGLASTDSS
ncbi:hypothetical protein L3X38_042228 [Prunus dulcis]|uniref:Uncharacterized protein n=1 Tax=Prunus dulcis TaxID=3755 RepID=A0AAD4UVW3_PRUDU|nr:hypothetical protein L3X38_042228 [Prunus dulcis]